MIPSDSQLAHLVHLMGSGETAFHPFTVMEFVKLGWLTEHAPMGFERRGSYSWTQKARDDFKRATNAGY